MKNAFRWKPTVGRNEERPGHLNGEELPLPWVGKGS